MKRIGSLFSGAGGLDMAVEAVFSGTTVWHSEIDKAASKVLAYRWPDVPNLGSITEINWATVEPVDILCGGFPCTDVSAAGKRAGMHGTRSGLWSEFAKAIDILRPRMVVIENVRGLLSAHANRPMESDDVSVGDGGTVPVLRAAGAVCGDLADLGYDASWATVSAASVGAPHRRERVFVLATDTTVGGRDTRLTESEGLRRKPVISTSGNCSDQVTLLPTPTAQAAKHAGDSRFGGGNGDVSNLWQIHHLLLPTPTTQDGANNGGPSQFERNTLPLNAEVMLLPVTTADNGWCEQCWMDYDSSTCLCDEFGYIQDQDTSELMLLPTPSTRDGKGATSSRSGDNKHDLPSALADPDLTGPLRAQGKADVTGKPPTLGPVSQISWGKYEPAIRRWEQIVGPAPAPTEPNKNDNPRLSAAFSEWLMGWPAGWVTDPDIGISRNDQLRIVGNGVCSQQAAAALRQLLVVGS